MGGQHRADSSVVTTDAVRALPAESSTHAPLGAMDTALTDEGGVRGGSALDALTAVLKGGGARVSAVLASAQEGGSREDWLGVVGECQSLINSLTAVQDVALAEVARRESDWRDDGTLCETVHGYGRVTLDAADLAAPALGASHAQAERRVEQAVRLGTGRVPVEADSGASPEASGLGTLHTAMSAGRLDGYRAGIIADELELAPADVAEAVVAALEPHLDDEGPSLRRRCRRLIARISPELLRQRAVRARAGTGLRRWVAEPGVDAWHGTFPSEDAALAWAAIDRLAHDLVAAGTCSSVEQARGKALTDLVTGNAMIDVQVVLTVPAEDCGMGAPDGRSAAEQAADRAAGRQTRSPVEPAEERTTDTPGGPAVDPAGDRPPPTQDDALVQVQGARPSEPLLVARSWLRDQLPRAIPDAQRPATRAGPVFAPCDPLTGARLDPADRLATVAYRPGAELAALVRARDGRCRFPGCTVAARFCDLDHVRPWPIGRTAARSLLSLCRRHHRIKQRAGWRIFLARDGTATWTDPIGRVRRTAPLDALGSLVLSVTSPDEPYADRSRAAPAPIAASASMPSAAASPWSVLETLLEFRLEHHRGHDLRFDPDHRRCRSSAVLRAGLARRRTRASALDAPPF